MPSRLVGKHVLVAKVFIMIVRCTIFSCIGCLLIFNSAFAEAPSPHSPHGKERRATETNDKKEEKPAEKTEEPKDKISVTKHTATIQGKEIKYTATAGKLVMRDDEGKPKALMFFIAYTKDGVKDLSQRPVTFAFNGGPGSSSVWLHLGLLGPRRVKLPDNTSAVPPPYELQDNQYSLLDITDLVFIDPVSTGFSRPAKGEKGDRISWI